MSHVSNFLGVNNSKTYEINLNKIIVKDLKDAYKRILTIQLEEEI